MKNILKNPLRNLYVYHLPLLNRKWDLYKKKCDKKTLILHKTTYPALRRPQGAFLISPTDIIEHHLQKKGLVEKKIKFGNCLERETEEPTGHQSQNINLISQALPYKDKEVFV